MRYIEYVYLVIAIGLVGYLTTHYADFNNTNKIAFIIGIVLASFMFSFRRQQRLRMEAEEREELRRLEEEVNDDDD